MVSIKFNYRSSGKNWLFVRCYFFWLKQIRLWLGGNAQMINPFWKRHFAIFLRDYWIKWDLVNYERSTLQLPFVLFQLPANAGELKERMFPSNNLFVSADFITFFIFGVIIFIIIQFSKKNIFRELNTSKLDENPYFNLNLEFQGVSRWKFHCRHESYQ